MATLSPKRASIPLLVGLQLLSRGKVRDCYLLPDGKHILQVATDAISIFDFILDAIVPMKGVILTAMSVFWFKKLEEFGIKTHLVACGSAIDAYLPEVLRNNADLQSRALVVEKLDMVDDVEFIVRHCLTGSAVAPYQETSMVCGHKILAGLQDGDELPCLLDTPSTKADVGHDEHMSADMVRTRYPGQTYTALRIFQIVQAHARTCGMVLADTKFEFGKDGTLADEVCTPDSSRYWSRDEWESSRKSEKRKAPTAYDKQFVRAWGIGMGINKLKPEKPEDVAAVHAMEVPENIIAKTTQIYRYIFWRLDGGKIEDYLQGEMGVKTPDRPKKKIVMVCGSESDLPLVKDTVPGTFSDDVQISVHVMSCHRNPEELRTMAMLGFNNADVVIGVGGKALALPGVIDALLHAAGHDIPVIGVALGEPGSKSLLAAKLSIEELPGAPVIIDELVGSAYEGGPGLFRAIARVVYGELPPSRPRTEKPVQMGVMTNAI